MRHRPEGLTSPHPLVDTLPLLYRGDPLSQQLCAAFDDVLAPILSTLDCLPAYLDPKTAPADMLDWLASWIGLTINEHEAPARKRELITAGASILPWRGTVRSVHEAVVAAFNRETEVIESGAATSSTTPDSAPGGGSVPTLVVRVFTDDPDDIDHRSLNAVVEAAKPAHVPHRVEVITPRSTPSRDAADAEESPVSETMPTAQGNQLTEDDEDLSADPTPVPPAPSSGGDDDSATQETSIPKPAEPPLDGPDAPQDGDQSSGR